MSIPQSAGGPIESRDDLVHYLADGCKPRADWRIGTEHEKTPFTLQGHHPVPYEGPRGIEALLDVRNMLAQGYRPVILSDGSLLIFAQEQRGFNAGLAFNF